LAADDGLSIFSGMRTTSLILHDWTNFVLRSTTAIVALLAVLSLAGILG
jgi:hypothetical protein